MKLFACDECGRTLYFDSTTCNGCHSRLGFLPSRCVVTSEKNGCRLCRNGADYDACNWLLDPGDSSEYCRSCRLNDVIPDLSVPGDRKAWKRLEAAKRRLLYSVLQLRLPLQGKAEAEKHGLAFAFLKDPEGSGKLKIQTGHAEGLITINLSEADDPVRERIRIEMGETYRTLLGHFRHEIGHYYWNVLVRDAGRSDSFRKAFGDERGDYAEAKRRHYSLGPPSDWPLRFVSAYASMHPWEDFAETWAHYLHLTDTLETARSHGLGLKALPEGPVEKIDRPATVLLRQVDPQSFDQLIAAWYPLTVALNELGRSMGVPDAYPFVLSPAAIAKLRFVHDLVRESSGPPGAISNRP